jgi:hypothetical protein
MFGMISASLAVICGATFAGAFFFWKSSFAARVMSKFLPTVGGFFSILGGPVLAMLVYVHLPIHGTWALLALPFYAVIVLSAALFGFIAARS